MHKHAFAGRNTQHWIHLNAWQNVVQFSNVFSILILIKMSGFWKLFKNPNILELKNTVFGYISVWNQNHPAIGKTFTIWITCLVFGSLLYWDGKRFKFSSTNWCYLCKSHSMQELITNCAILISQLQWGSEYRTRVVYRTTQVGTEIVR